MGISCSTKIRVALGVNEERFREVIGGSEGNGQLEAINEVFTDAKYLVYGLLLPYRFFS